MLDPTPLLPPGNTLLNNLLFQDVLKTHTIKIVAPGSGTCLKKIEQLRLLAPLTTDIPHNLIDQTTTFHANTDNERFSQLKNALYDPSPQTIIWTLRGGYGSARLIDQLLLLPAPKQKKIFIGFSDNTALHLFLSQHWHWQTIHGAGFLQLLDAQSAPENYLKIAQIITKSVPSQTFTALKPLNYSASQLDNINGYLTGGNLTLVENSIGTPWQLQTHQKIVFLEEVGEKGYRIDRSLNHLRQAALLVDSQAIVFGDFTHDTNDHHAIQYALERFAQESTIPIYQTNLFGHGYHNYPLIYNSLATIQAANDGLTHNLVMTW